MIAFRYFLCCIALATVLAPAFPSSAQKKGDKPEPKPAAARPMARMFSDKELADAHKALAGLDGEQIMLLNGLRYLMKPADEAELMARRYYIPCTLPAYGIEDKRPMTQLEVLRLWVLLESGMPVDDTLKREVDRFMKIVEHKRVNHSIAVYAVSLMVCRAALMRPEFAQDRNASRTLDKLAKALSELALRPRELLEEGLPLMKGRVFDAMWFANHLWRGVMMRAAIEMNIDVNEKIWETDLKTLSYNAHDKLGWISAPASGRGANTDLDTNLMAAAAFTLALQASRKSVGSSTRNAIAKKFSAPALFARLENDWKEEVFDGGRLMLLRSCDPEYAPEGKDGYDWRFALRQRAVRDQMASGAVYTDRTLALDLGLCGLTPLAGARETIETALQCLSVCGGVFRPKDSVLEPPLKGLSGDRIKAAIKALSVLHASVAPILPDEIDDPVLDLRVNEAIDRGVEWLKTAQLVDGGFDKSYIGITAISLTAMLSGGMKPEDQPIQKGLSRLMSVLPDCISNPSGNTPGRMAFLAYEAGMALDFFAEYHKELIQSKGVLKAENPSKYASARDAVWKALPQKHREIIQRLVEFLDLCHAGPDSGGWGYGPLPAGSDKGHSDNSISQYAGCGYKSASALGARVNVDIFEMEARSLIRQFIPETGAKKVPFRILWEPPQEDEPAKASRYLRGGAWAPRQWKSSTTPGGWGYGRTAISLKGITSFQVQHVATAMALLASAKDELWVRGKLKVDLHEQIDLHIFAGQAYLAKHIPDLSDPLDEPREPNAQDKIPQGIHARADWQGGWGGNYNLYAIERGCVLSNIRKLNGEVDWYMSAAIVLCNHQGKEGDWGDPLSTARAILILRRHAPPAITTPPPPPTPRDKPRNPTTGDRKLTQPKSPVTGDPIKPEPKPAPQRGPVTGPADEPKAD